MEDAAEWLCKVVHLLTEIQSCETLDLDLKID